MQTRNILVVIFTIIVIGVLGIGFYYVGSPEYNRKLNIDKQKRADLWKLKGGVDIYVSKNCKLPQNIEELKLIRYNQPKLDLSNYTYKVIDKNNYELCADFNFDFNVDNEYNDEDKLSGSSTYRTPYSYAGDFDIHKAGTVCFKKPLYEDNYAKDNCTKKK